MSSWKPSFNPDNFYFVTTNTADHLHLFQQDVFKRLLLDAFDCFRLRKRMKLYCFVIMPNHIHFIAQFTNTYSLSDMVRDFKRETSDRIIRQLKAERDLDTLQVLSSKVDHPEKQSHKVWENDYNGKEIFSADFLQQKMDYIHQNPCQPHWRLSEEPEGYIWSSARFYLTTDPCIIPIDDVRVALML